MATKKKTKKKQTKRTAGRKASPKKKLTRKKSAPKKAGVRTKPGSKKMAAGKTAVQRKRPVRGKREIVDEVAFTPKGLGARAGGQSGDLQGLTNRDGADSESVDELLEEGNAFEAEIVKGVEDAGDADAGEVRTHEVPEDDVPGEYLDKE
jgi:hypothetical protein